MNHRAAGNYLILLVRLVAPLAACGCNGGTSPAVDTSADVTAGWEGLAWGSPVADVKRNFPRMKDVDATAAGAVVVESGEARTFAGLDMALKLAFMKGRFVGIGLTRSSLAADDQAKVRAELTKWLGEPTGQGIAQQWTRGPVKATLTPVGQGYNVTLLNTQAALAANGK